MSEINRFAIQSGEARRELARRDLARRKRIEESGDPDLVQLQDDFDFLWMSYEEGREVRSEWAALARVIAPKADGEAGCDCDVCAISRALDLAAQPPAEDGGPE